MPNAKQRKFEIHGKTRIIRDIRQDDETSFFAYYKGYEIEVWEDEDLHIYAQCVAPDGGLIVDGYVTGHRCGVGPSIWKGIKMCLENIYYKEKPEMICDT